MNMQENKHTPEPWYSDSKGGIWRRHPSDLYENGGGVAGDKPLAFANIGWSGENAIGYPVEANASRIVACVNYCAGIPDDALLMAKEEGPILTVRRRVKSEKQRDELLAALKPFASLLKEHHGRLPDSQPIYGIGESLITVGDMRRAKAAVASVESGAA